MFKSTYDIGELSNFRVTRLSFLMLLSALIVAFIDK